MAVVQKNVMLKIFIKVNVSTKPSEPSYKNRNIGSGYIFDPELTDAKVYAIADAFGDLAQGTVEQRCGEKRYDIVNEE